MAASNLAARALALALRASMEAFDATLHPPVISSPAAIIAVDSGGVRFKKKEREAQGPDYYRGRITDLRPEHLGGTGAILKSYAPYLLKPTDDELRIQRTTLQHAAFADLFEVYRFDTPVTFQQPERVAFLSLPTHVVRTAIERTSAKQVTTKIREFVGLLRTQSVDDAHAARILEQLIDEQVTERVAAQVNAYQSGFDHRLSELEHRLKANERAVAKPAWSLSRAVLDLVLGTPKRLLEDSVDLLVVRLARWIFVSLFF